MSTARSELFTYMAAAFATVLGLFTLQQVYGACIDVAYHAELAQRGPNEKLLALRKGETDTLGASKLSIDRAKSLLAEKGREGFGSVAPTQSDDLSAVSGWVRLHSFKPAINHPIRTARVVPVVVPAPAPADIAPVPVAAPVRARPAPRAASKPAPAPVTAP
jgi:hypothetical protein